MPIFDQGYQHWKGPLAGHAWRWLAVARHGVRATLRGRIVKLMLFLAWVPAIALVVVLATWGLLEQQAESVLTFLRRLLPADVIARLQDFRAAFCFLTLLVSSILIGIRIETERWQIVRQGIAGWVNDHPPPVGVRMFGTTPALRYVPPRPGKGDVRPTTGKLVPMRDESSHPE